MVRLDINEFETYKLHSGYWLDKYSIDLKIASKNDRDKKSNEIHYIF